ncbi:tetratricopeptide repeat protein [bacterium]|nr:tetratricopeptide repeat protein [bacterium]
MRFYFNKTITILEFVLIISPSLVIPFMVEAYELPKTLFILLLLSFSLITYKFRTGTEKSNKIPGHNLSYLNLVLFGYLTLYVLSSLFSSNLSTSLLGYYGRFAGSLLFLGVTIFFLNENEKKLANWSDSRISFILSLGSVVPVLFSYAQILNPSVLFQTFGRVYSTFGQPNWFGGYLVIVLLIHTISYVVDRRNLSLFYFVFTLIPIFYTLSLSALLTLILALCIFWFVPFTNKSSFRLNIILLFFILTTVLHGGSLVLRLNHQVFASDNNENSILTNDTGYIRGILAKSAFLQVVKSPKLLLIGAGPENFAYDFKRPSSLNQTSEWSYLYDKPHNFFVEEFFETGILGLLFFTALFIFLAFNLKKNIYYILPLALLFNSLFGWLTAYTYLLLFIFLVKFLIKQGFDRRYVSFTFRVKNFLIYDFIFVFTLIYVFSFSIIKVNPCLSFKLFPYYQNFSWFCLSGNLNDENTKTILNLNPKNRLLKESLALKIMNKNPAKSKELLVSLLTRDYTNPIYFYYLGQLYEKQGDTAEAVKQYTLALELKPRFLQAQSRMLYLNTK